MVAPGSLPNASEMLSLLDKAEMSREEQIWWHTSLASKYRGRERAYLEELEEGRRHVSGALGSSRYSGTRGFCWDEHIDYYRRWVKGERADRLRWAKERKDEAVRRGGYRAAAQFADDMCGVGACHGGRPEAD